MDDKQRRDIKARMQGNLERGTPLATCIMIEIPAHNEYRRSRAIAEIAHELGCAKGREEGIDIGVNFHPALTDDEQGLIDDLLGLLAHKRKVGGTVGVSWEEYSEPKVPT